MGELVDQGAEAVFRRRVFYIPGYDPVHPRRYRELYRKEGALQARIQRKPHGGLRAAAQQLFQFEPADRSGRLVTSTQSPASGRGKRGKIGHGAGSKTRHCTAQRTLCCTS